MRAVLRGLLFLEDTEKTEATENYASVDPSRLLALDEHEERVLEFMLDFFARHAEAPSYQAIHGNYATPATLKDMELVEEVSAQIFQSGGSFTDLYEREVEEQGTLHMKRQMKEALTIATDGVDVKGQLVKGIEPAVAHLFTAVRTPPPKDSGRLPADMLQASAGLDDLYQKRKNNPGEAFGVYTGYSCIDQATGGIKKKQLYIHAGFANHLKSTFLLNQCVNAMVNGYSPLLFSSEMDSSDLMLMAISIHSADIKFRSSYPEALNSTDLLNGTLPGTQQENLFRDAREDFVGNPKHGTFRIVDSAEFTTFGSVMQRTVREHSLNPVDLLWVDYLTRLPLDSKYSRMDHTTGMNLSIAEAKQFSMAFGDGEGLSVATAFQINRTGLRIGKQGKKQGEQDAGKLDATALGQFNAAEKEADLITYTWFGDTQRADSTCLLGMIKNRFGPVLLEPAILYYDEQSRKIEEEAVITTTVQAVSTVDFADEVGGI